MVFSILGILMNGSITAETWWYKAIDTNDKTEHGVRNASLIFLKEHLVRVLHVEYKVKIHKVV
jgi:hypothetical protein